MNSNAPKLQIQYQNPETMIVQLGRHVAFYSRRPPSKSEISAGMKVVGAIRGPWSLLFIVDPLDQPKSTPDEPRTEFIKILNAHGSRLSSIAVVITLEGFAGSMLRSFATGILLVTRINAPNKSFSSIPKAVDWLVQRSEFSQAEGQEILTAIKHR